ncbi:MAG TPA: hypothetical protein ENH02_05460 [Bacteroidetes bacterium]|nr:hypothetical protein [Bacteroidota bacterium]
MKKAYFKEEQHFTNPWIWLFSIVVFTASIIPVLYIYLQQITSEQVPAGSSDSKLSLLITMIVQMLVFALVFFLLKTMKLVTEIKEGAFFYRYPPFINKEKRIGKEEIECYEIREYKPIREYGGWGLRQGMGKSGKAYNVSGKTGLQLYLKNGKKVLFGTQRGEALLRALDKIMKDD